LCRPPCVIYDGNVFFRKKSPHRLYYPVKSRWFTKPRLKVRSPRRAILGNMQSHVAKLLKNSMSFVLAGIGLAVLIGFLFLSSYFSVTKIEVVRQDFNINSAAIENHLNSFIGKNILFFPRAQAVNAILQKFPEFASITLNRQLPHTLKINLESYPIIANLRAFYVLPKPELAPVDPNAPLVTENKELMDHAFNLTGNKNNNGETPVAAAEKQAPVEQKCLLNKIGQAIFDKEENLELITVTVIGLTQPIADREQVIPKETISYMLDTIQYFSNLFKMQVKAVEFRPAGRELRLKTDSHLVIWLTLEKDYKEQLDKLKTIYEPAELNKENLSYIDLRVKEKVIYCRRNTSCDKQ